MRKAATQHFCLLVLFLLVHHAGFSQASFWQTGNRTAPQVSVGPATRYLTLLTNLDGLRSQLAGTGAAARGGEQSVSFPLPDGSFAEVILEPTAVLVPKMQAEHPEIQTFKGASADGQYSARLTVSPYGASARIGTPEGVVYIQPLTPSTPEWSVVYYAHDAERPVGIGCGVQDMEDEETGTAGKTAAISYGDANLRTYVLAVAATGEYIVWAGSQAAALTQITTTVNNVNAIYERDLGVTFTLTSPASIRYTDSTTDPYTRTLGAATLSANQTAIDVAVGSANYDLGHVFGGQWTGGLAYLSSVCGSNKAGAASGLDPTVFSTGPSGAVFDGTVAHEIGHQFSATHSFAANNGSCSGNTTPSTGWEPGGGSTIMAYAGTCTGNSYQNNSDLYFHVGNLSQMSSFMLGTGNACATLTAPSNSAPSLTASTTAFTIPHSTPFRLTASATDANNTGLTYTFEQMDAVGTATSSAPSSTSTTAPQFRSFFPSTSTTRYLPNLTSQFSASATPYEVLPTVARTMNFRATVRDNNSGFGRTSAENIAVTTSSCGPFSITSQTAASSFTANGTNTMTVTWNTASACVTCANVKLLFTRDGGSSFSTILASTPNDGTETFTVPNLATCDGRLYLECATIPFFDVNSAAVTISSSCLANGATFSPSTALSAPTAGNATLNQSLSAQYGTAYSSPITGNIATTDPQGNLSVYNANTSSCGQFGNVVRYDTYTFYPGTSATYTFNASGSTSGLVYHLYEGTYSASSACTGFLASSATYTTSVALGTSVSATLCRDKQYTLVVTSFSPTQPATLPASYSIAISGGSIYTGTPNPGLNYGYVIVNTTTGNIVAIQSTGNMSNATTFPNGYYTVYGLSTSSTVASLSSYVGGSFTAFNTAVNNQTGGLCASLSSNTRSVTINPTALPLADVRLEASLTGRRSTRAMWTVVGTEAGVRRYELERSYDGQNFETATVLATAGQARYEVAETSLREEATGIHYRVAARMLSGEARYSSTAYLSFEGPASPALVVAPNPIQGGVLRAEMGVASAGQGTAMVLDATGRVVISSPLTLAAGRQRIELPVGGLSAGVYLLRVDGAGAPLQVRFVKSK